MCHTFWALSEQRLWLFKSLKVQINKCVRAAETNPFLCCLEQLFAVTVVSASSPDFCHCSWRWRDVLRTLQVVWDKVTSRFQGDESSWAGKKNTFYGSDLINGTVLQPTVEHKPLHNFFVLLSGLHPVDAWKFDSNLAFNAHRNFSNYSTYCWTAPNRKTDRVETNNDHKRTVVSVHSLEHMDVFLQLLIQRESDEELGGQNEPLHTRFTSFWLQIKCQWELSRWLPWKPTQCHINRW